MEAAKSTRNTLTQHKARCHVCKHPQRGEIEAEFLDWTSPNRIAREFSVTGKSIYRQAHATGLMVKRQENVRRALEKIIEHAGNMKVNV